MDEIWKVFVIPFLLTFVLLGPVAYHHSFNEYTKAYKISKVTIGGNMYAGTVVTTDYNLITVDKVSGKIIPIKVFEEKVPKGSTVVFDGRYVGYGDYRAYVKPMLDAAANSIGLSSYKVAIDDNKIILYTEPPNKVSDYLFALTVGILVGIIFVLLYLMKVADAEVYGAP